MKIQTLIDGSKVHLDLEAADLDEALTVVSDLTSPMVGLSGEVVFNGLKERERLGSTAIGGGFAIPHCKLKGIDGIIVVLVRFRTAIDFDPQRTGDDGVRFLFVVLSPPNEPALHLQALSQIARTLKSEVVRQRLLEVDEVDDVVGIVQRAADGEPL